MRNSYCLIDAVVFIDVHIQFQKNLIAPKSDSVIHDVSLRTPVTCKLSEIEKFMYF